MSKMILIRNVPDEVHRELKERAARARMTLSNYVLREMEKHVARPLLEDVLARVVARPALDIELSESPAEIIRAQRDGRCQ